MQLLLSTSNSKFFSKVVSAKKRTVSRPLILPRIHHSAPAFMLTAAPSPVPAPASPVMPSSSQRATSAY